MQPQQPANQPMPGQQQPAPMQPAPAPAGQQPTGIQTNPGKDKTISLLLGIGSLVVFVVGFIFGYAALIGAFLGMFGFKKAMPINYTTGKVLGIIGTVLNFLFFLLALILG